MNMYRENILSHYKNPDNSGNLSSYDIKIHAHNPLCGDEIEIKIKLDNNKVKDVKFNAKGCAISLASADILLEDIKDKLDSFDDLSSKELEDICLVLKSLKSSQR